MFKRWVIPPFYIEFFSEYIILGKMKDWINVYVNGLD